jgi:hypothetical protein
MTGWFILFMCCVSIAAICLGIDLIIERKNLKYGYEANYWAIMVIAICGVLALIFGLVAIVIPIDSAHAVADVQAILETDPTNDVAIARLVEWTQDIKRFGMFADKWPVREEIAELMATYGG